MARPSSVNEFVDLLARLCREPPDRRFLAAVLDAMAEAMDCERVFLFRLNRAGGFRVIAARSRDREEIAEASARMSHFAVSRMVRTERAVHVQDAKRDRRYRPEEALEGKRGPVSIIVLPVRIAGPVEAGVYADHRFRQLRLGLGLRRRLEAWSSLLGLSLRLGRRDREPDREAGGAQGSEEGGGTASSRDGRAVAVPGEASLDAAGAPEPETFHGMITANPDLKECFQTIRSLSESDLPVLIRGATGSGKTLLARAIHLSSSRRDRPFISINPSAIPENLLESELLGHVRGAFTGADSSREGIFVQADGGTIFLDEVADMSLGFQTKILRVLQDGEVRPLGAKGSLRVDVRIIASTSQDLERWNRQGKFRKDLYFRLKGAVLEIPPLAERREDILPLVEHFLRLYASREGKAPPELSPAARLRLLGYHWPGNVRELENEMRRLVALGHRQVDEAQLAPFLRGRGSGGPGLDSTSATLEQRVEEAERRALLESLQAAGGNKSLAARRLGISRKSLYRRLARYGL